MPTSGPDYVPLYQTGLWILAIALAAFVLRKELGAVRAAVVARLEAGAAIKIGPVELQQLNERIDEVQNEITQLFLLTMSDRCYATLNKLVLGFGPFEKNDGLERELQHLRNLGYVAIEAVRALPPAGDELSDFAKITQAGRKFVDLRERAVRVSERTSVSTS